MTMTAKRMKPRPPMNQSKGSLLVRLALTPTDFAAIEHVRAKHGHTQKAPAVRMCLEQQRLRDLAYGTGADCPNAMNDEYIARLIAVPRMGDLRQATADVLQTLGRPASRRAMGLPPTLSPDGLIQWSMWLYEDHKQFVQQIMNGWAFEADGNGNRLPLQQTDAFRLAIRIQAILDGFTPGKKGWS